MPRLRDFTPLARRYIESEKRLVAAKEAFFSAPFGGGPSGLFALATREKETADQEAHYNADRLAREICRALGLDVPSIDSDQLFEWHAQAYAWTAFHELCDELASPEAT